MRGIAFLVLLLFISCATPPRVFEKEGLNYQLAYLKNWAQVNLEKRYEGRKLSEKPLEHSELHFFYHPNRKIPIEIPNVSEPCESCNPLYKPYLRGVPGAFWKNYILYPNNMPYLDNHIMLIGGESETQDLFNENPQVAKDLVEIQKMIPNLRFYFTHFSGNSLKHFHVHMSEESLPLEKLINAGRVDLKTEIEEKGLLVSSFNNHKCYKGVFIEGDKDKMPEYLFKFLQALVKKGYLYNLAYLPPKDLTYRSIVFIKEGKNTILSKNISGLEVDMKPGGTELMGAQMFNTQVSFDKSKATQDAPFFDLKDYDKFTLDYCNKLVIDPRDEFFDFE